MFTATWCKISLPELARNTLQVLDRTTHRTPDRHVIHPPFKLEKRSMHVSFTCTLILNTKPVNSAGRSSIPIPNVRPRQWSVTYFQRKPSLSGHRLEEVDFVCVWKANYKTVRGSTRTAQNVLMPSPAVPVLKIHWKETPWLVWVPTCRLPEVITRRWKLRTGANAIVFKFSRRTTISGEPKRSGPKMPKHLRND